MKYSGFVVTALAFFLVASLSSGVDRTAEPASAAPAPFLTLNQIETLINQQGIRTIEGLLAQLPAANRENYVLVYDSRSIQFASHDLPRVILRTPDSQLLMAFNSGVDAQGQTVKGGNRIEAIEFEAKTSSFNFHIVQFDPQKVNTAKVVRNVTGCTSCHSTDLRPNFLTYYHWAGMFGSMDDFLGGRDVGRKYLEKGFRRESFPPSHFDPDQDNIIDREHEAIRNNFTAWKAHPRYSQLADLANFSDGDSYSRAHFTARPNIIMQATLLRMNMERVARLVSNTADYSSYRFAIVGALACDNDWPVASNLYFPAGYAASSIVRIDNLNIGKYDSSRGEWDPFFWLFEVRDISTRAWEMIYRIHYPISHDPFNDGTSRSVYNRDVTYKYVAWLLAQKDPELKTMIESTPLKNSDLFGFQIYDDFPASLCGKIQDRSSELITDLWAKKLGERALFERIIHRTEAELYLLVDKKN